MLANQTTLIFVIIMVPKFPWSLDRFQTPFTVETISSRGRSLRFLLSKIAPRSFSSRYILLELNALNFEIEHKIYENILVILVNSNDRSEQSWTSRKQIGEDELKSCVITLGQ